MIVMKTRVLFLLLLSFSLLIFVGCGEPDFLDMMVVSPFKASLVEETDVLSDPVQSISIDEKTRDSHLVERLSDYFGFDVEFDVMWEKQVLFNEKNAILYHVRAYDDGIDQGEFEICIYQR